MSYNITVTADQLSVVDATESTPLVTIRKPTSGGSDVTVDTALSTSSYNAIANAPVATAINSVNASLTNHTGDILALQNAVSSLGSGQPTVVTQASAMSDTSKIYLYVGNEEGYTSGHWYVYNGSSWVSGGEYGATGLNETARNLLAYLFRHIEYTASDANTYITALLDALTPEEVVTPYTITYTLTNATSSNNASTIDAGASYSTSVLPNSGYTFTAFTVTMGGVDITSTARALYTGGEVSIDSVTGNVVITATAIENPYSYVLGTNLIKVNGGTYCQTAGGLFVNTGNMLTKRRTVFAESGETCARTTTNYSDLTTYVDSEYFPIPVPPDATGMTITWAPTTNYISSICMEYDGTTYPYYTSVTPEGWTTGWTTGGSITQSFTAGTFKYLGFTFKKDNAGNAYTSATDLSALTLTFTTN